MSHQFGGGFHYPTVVNSYASSSSVFAPTPLGLLDTESDLVADQAMDPSTPYTLPGLPFGPRTPIQRLLKMTSVTIPGAVMYVSPEDFKAQFPALADFRQLVFGAVNAFARVQWNGSLWQLIDRSSDVLIVPLDQFQVVTA